MLVNLQCINMSQNISQSVQQNLVLAEQRAVLSEDAVAGGLSLDNSMADTLVMREQAWHTEDLLKKPIVLATVAWTTSQTLGTDIFTTDLPNAVWEVASALPQSLLDFFTFYRSDLVLRFQLNSTKFHLGRLTAYFDPLYTSSIATSVYRASGFPNVKLDASESTVAELNIPYVHFQNYLNMLSTDLTTAMGRLHLLVLNPLAASTGSTTSVDVTILVYARKPSIHVPIYSHDVTRSRSSAKTLYNAVAQAWWDDIPILGNIIRNPGEAFNAASDIVSTGVQLWEGNFAGALQSGQNAIKETSFVLNHDYPVSVNAEGHFMNHAVSNIAAGKGIYQGTRLALNPLSSTIPLQGVLPTSTHEMSIDYIKQIPMLQSQITWQTTTTQASSLYNQYVAPQFLTQYITSSDPDLALIYPTYIHHLSSMFRFWRGSIILRLEAVCTQFHTGRLLIAYLPGVFTSTPTMAQAMNSPSLILDLQQAKEIEFEMPYQTIYPWLYTSLSTATSSSGDDRSSSTLGSVFIYVLNTLTATNNIPTSITVNLYVRGGKDLEFSVPFTPHVVLSALPTVFNAIAQAAEEVEESSTRSDVLDSSPPVQLAKSVSDITKLPPFWSHGESFDSLLDYCRRSGLADFNNVGSASVQNSIDFLQYAVAPRVYISSSTLTTAASNSITYYFQTPLDVVADFFRCWRGSIRFKFVSNVSSVSQCMTSAYIQPSYNNSWFSQTSDASTSSSLARALAYNSVNAGIIDVTNKNPCLEVEVPFYSNVSLMINTDINQAASAPALQSQSSVLITYMIRSELTPIETAINITSGTSSDVASTIREAYVFVSAGDDLHMFYLIPPLPRNIFIPFTAITPVPILTVSMQGSLV